MAEKTKKRQPKIQALLTLLVGLALVFFLNILANSRLGNTPLYGNIDLTEEKRFTLTPGTKNLLSSIDEPLTFRILLDGNLPANYQRFQNAIIQTLDDFRSQNKMIEYYFDDPNEGSREEVNQRRKEFAELQMRPHTITSTSSDGASLQVVMPYVFINYGERERIVNLLENEVPGTPEEVVLNNSTALLEYRFASAIKKLVSNDKPLIVLSTGQGELTPIETADLEKELRENYEVGRLDLDSFLTIPPEVKALVIAKPTRPFSEKNKFKLDQYVMNGGKILWLIDKVAVSLDSLRGRREFYPTEYELNIDDLLFRYGLRLPSSLVLDKQSTRIQIVPGTAGDAAQNQLFPYPYHPLMIPRSRHPVVRSIEPVNMFYAGFIDISPQTKTDLQKEILLMSSPNASYQRLPVSLDFNFLRFEPVKYTKDSLVTAVLVEGEFPSMYENRLDSDNLAVLEEVGVEFKARSAPNRMIVVSDGDVARNAIMPGNRILPLGMNPYERYPFGNKEFLLNALEYLLDADGVVLARGKEVRLRLINQEKAKEEAGFWQIFNFGVPMLFLALFGLIYTWWRRRKFAK